MTARRVALATLLLGACATPPAPPIEAPAAKSSPAVVVPAVAADPAPIEPLPSIRPLPRDLLLTDAVSLAVFDVAGMRRLGLNDSLRLFARDQFGASALACAEPLLEETRRVVTTRSLARNGLAIAIEQPEPVETLLDCFAQHAADAHARSIGGRPALELRVGAIAMNVGGTLVVGNEAGLSNLLGVPEPAPPDDERPRGDVLADEFQLTPTEPPGLDALIGQLPDLASEPLVAAVQSLGGMDLGGGRAVIRHTPDGLTVQLDILGFGDQMGMAEGVPGAGGDEMMRQVVDSLRRSLTSGLEDDEQAAPLIAALDHVRVERRGSDLRIAVDVHDVAPVVGALEALARGELAEKDTAVPQVPATAP